MELLWRAMHRHHDPIVVAMIVDKHALELHDRVSHLEGEMEFGFVQWSFSNEMGGSNDLYNLGWVNYNTPKKCTKPFCNHRSYLLRKVVETKLSTASWYISRTSKGSNIKCYAIKMMTHEKWKNVIGGNILAPCVEVPLNCLSSKSQNQSQSPLVLIRRYWDVCDGFGAWLCSFQANNPISLVNEKKELVWQLLRCSCWMIEVSNWKHWMK